MTIESRRIVHTSHPSWGYRIRARGLVVVWAPEFYRFEGKNVNGQLGPGAGEFA